MGLQVHASSSRWLSAGPGQHLRTPSMKSVCFKRVRGCDISRITVQASKPGAHSLSPQIASLLNKHLGPHQSGQILMLKHLS